MKNIHLLPTDNKPSRLYFNVNDKEFQICEIEKPSTILKPNRHIYITNDEKFVKDEYVTDGIEVIKVSAKLVDAQGLIGRRDWKKIILTTDQDLIGVQAIDDEFLEFIVKNPSCEKVEIDKAEHGMYKDDVYYKLSNKIFYKIIIPKEEPKQETTLEEASTNYANKNFSTKDIVADEGWYVSWLGFRSGAKWQKERYTIEEQHIGHTIDELNKAYIKGFNQGSSYQQERSYSEEEVLQILSSYADWPINNVKEWFEQFKNK